MVCLTLRGFMLKHFVLRAILFSTGVFTANLTTTQAATNSYSGISERQPNVTLNFPQNLPSALTNSFTSTDAFPGLVFTNPLVLATAPRETNRLYVAERAGRIQVITNLANPTRTQFFNLSSVVNASGEGGLLGLAFHPNYLSNRQFFVFYTRTANNGTGSGYHTRLSRFERTTTNINLALTNTEVVLYSQYNNAGNHNGGDIHFGDDGYLYVGVGDEGGSNDSWTNSQIIDKDFFSGLLRIDVDKKPGSLEPNHHPALSGMTNYAIPPDNPFIGVTNYYGSNVVPDRVRTEFYAVGLRNPFRFSFDHITGLLYVGDVGQNTWEEINLVTNGGNYGWAAREGFGAGPKPGSFSANSFVNPIHAYGRTGTTNHGNSVTGGRVYRGNRFPELVGKYIFADYGSGNIWSLTHNGTASTSFAWLYNDNDIVAFGEDPSNGDLLLCDLVANQVKRLVYDNPGTNALPTNLSDAGIFADMENLTPYEGIIPYTVNMPFWSDNAIKRRWYSLPNTNLHLDFNIWGTWNAPTTSVWIKHFDLEQTSGVPASVRRMETRIMVRNASPAGGYGLTYRWGSSHSNAVLIPAQGLDEQIVINDGGIIRTQVWRYPSRGACQTCHNLNAGFTLSFNTPQMNKVHDFGDTTTNQIAALTEAGYFSGAVSNIHLLRKLAHPTNTEFSVTYRARSYLESNCSQCHRPGGPVPAAFDARIQTPLSQAGIIDGSLTDDFSDPENRVIRRGSSPHSMVLTRISTRDLGQMPPLGSTVIDTQAVALINAWITGEAADYATYAEWQERHFGSAAAPEAQRDQDPDSDGSNNEHEFLTGTQPTNTMDFWEYTDLIFTGTVPSITFHRPAQAGFDVQVSTSLVEDVWLSLDVPENAPVFGTTAVDISAPDSNATNLTERFYRVRAYEP